MGFFANLGGALTEHLSQSEIRIVKPHLSSRPLTEIFFESKLLAVTVQTCLRKYFKLMLTLVSFERKLSNKIPIFPVISLI